VSAPHADRDGSECWELEDGDTGEPLLPGGCVLRVPAPVFDELVAELDRPAQVVEPLAELAEKVAANPARTPIDTALREWEARGPTSLTIALLADALYGARRELDSSKSLEWERAYWEWCARFGRRKRIWRSGWDRWAFKWFAGGDEFGRHTIVVGPWVIALWSCRCELCKADEAALLAIIDADIDADPTTPEEES
jgi:hypothetical protein